MSDCPPKVYDEASRHYNSDDWPEGLPKAQAHVHTGIYLQWLIEHDLLAPAFAEQHADAVAAVKAGRLSGPKFYEQIGGAFRSDMLNDVGQAFTEYYFTLGVGLYLRDYGMLIANRLESAYHVEDKPSICRRIADRIDLQFGYWQEHIRR